jgi:hypothetical protein
MSLISYQLVTRRLQKKSGLSDKQFNALDVEHSNENLIKHLQSLRITSATGFYGTFTIGNQAYGSSVSKFIQVKLAYKGDDITSYITINGENTDVLTIPIGSRLPLPTSLLQLKIIIEGPPGVISGIEPTNVGGFSAVDATYDDPTNENTITLLVEKDFIDGGNLTLDFIINTT